MTANKWYCIAQTTTFDTSCGITIYSEGVAVSFTTSVRFGSSSINIASCVIDGETLLSVRLRETDNKWCIDLLCNTEINPNTDITDSTYWEVQNTPAGTGSIIAIINDISKEFNTGIKGGESLWETINVGTEEAPVWALKPKKIKDIAPGVISESFLTFGGIKSDENEEGGGGIATFDVFVGNNGPYSLQDGKVNLPAYPVVPTDYASVGWVEENYTPVDAHNTLSQRVTALENSGTGGGSGGTTSVVSYNASVLKGKLLGTLTINGIDNKIYAPTIPTKLSAFTNDEGYVTEDWVNDQGFLTAHQSLTHLLSKEEAADTYQPKGDYAVLDDLNSYLLISTAKNTYATKTALNNAIQAHDELREEFDALNGLLTDDTSGYIDTWNEVKSFLDGYSDSQDLATILSGMNKDIANRATIEALNGATARISTLETTLSTEQGYIDTLQGYFTSGKAKKAIADGDGNNIVDTYTTKVALNSTNTNLDTLNKEFSEFKELVNSLWYLDPDHADTVRTKLNVVVEQAISFGGYGESSGGGGGITTVTKQMVLDALEYTPYDAANPKGYITASAIPTSIKNPYGLTINNSAGTAQVSYDGSATKSLTLTKAMVGLSNVQNIAVYTRELGVNGVNWTFASTYYTEDGKSTSIYAPTTAGTAGQYLVSNGTGAPYWYTITPYDANKSRTANTILAAPNGSAGSATFRKLVSADIPNLDWSKITSGKPTTLSGYGITNAYTKDEANGKFFGIDVSGDGINAVGITNLNKGGYGYAKGGWWGSGPALAFGSTNGYTALIQQGTNTYTLHVSYKSNGGDIQEWKTLAFTDSNVLNAQNLRHSNGTLGATVSSAGNVGIGTTEPSYKLDVRGIIHTSERLNVHKWSGTTLQGGLYALIDSSSVCQLNLVSASQTTSLRNKDFNISNYTGGNITLARVDQWDTPLAAIRIMKDSAVIVSSSDKIIRHLVAGVEDYFEKGYLEVAGMNFAITSKETNIADITGVAFDWKKEANNLELSRVYYDATTGSVLRNDFNFKVNGNIVITGAITFGSASDRRLKDNIKSMTDKQAVAVLSALNPVTFSWNTIAYELGKLSGTSDGFIADEYEKLIPNSGRDIWANYRAINYERVTGYLVKGWQKHQSEIERLKDRVKELENELKRYRRA